MYVVMAVVSESPYRESVQALADNYTDLVGGTVRLIVPASVEEGEVELLEEGPAEDAEALVERAEEETEAEFEHIERGPETPQEAQAVLGPTVEECIRELAACDLGVVGKTMEPELPGGRGLGRDVEKLKQAGTKPLVIVSETVRPIRRALFVYTDHTEAGHALELAGPLSAAGVAVHLLSLIPPLGRSELVGTGAAYLEAHDITFTRADLDCAGFHAAEGGPASEILECAEEETADLIVMGGTRRGALGRLLWPELAHEVAWSADLPVLIWY